MADLQELVDDLAAEIGRPISVEDRRWRLVAHSAHTGATDAVRQTTILAREAPPEVAAWLESLGILRASALVDVPANAALGMAARACMPVRHEDVLLGFVWVVVGDTPLDARERAALADVAGAAQELLWERRVQHEAVQHHLRTLLDDEEATAVRHAAVELAAVLRLADDEPVAIAVADAPEDAGERARRRWARGGLAWARRDRGLVIVAGLGSADHLPGLADVLAHAGCTAGGIALTGGGLAGAAVGLREAGLALLVVRAVPELGPVALRGALGGWGVVADLWDRAGHPDPPGPVRLLAANAHGDELVAAVEAVLESGGDVAAAAQRLGVHRATLYRRLRRARDVCDLDVFDGDDRLVLHLGLRIARLAAAR